MKNLSEKYVQIHLIDGGEMMCSNITQNENLNKGDNEKIEYDIEQYCIL